MIFRFVVWVAVDVVFQSGRDIGHSACARRGRGRDAAGGVGVARKDMLFFAQRVTVARRASVTVYSILAKLDALLNL